jgi:aminoglycoside phosphotransferase family enzyme/predicted kinase
VADQARLVAALRDPARFGGACKHVELIETHISCVLLTGTAAYKIKKPVQLGFLDFTTLAARRFYCEEELRLNRRLAPGLYLGVVAITGDVDRPEIDGSGPVLDYAVKMREFPQEALLSHALDRGELALEDIDTLAARVARFHGEVAVATPDGRYGDPEDVLRAARANFDAIRPLAGSPRERAELDALEAWTSREYVALRPRLAARRDGGFVRECHGDLHLGNIARVDGEITVFDCIEFNDRMRWIDVMSEVAFTVMDLHHRGRSDLAHRFVNAYLELTGDYAGVLLLPFHLVYRAMVRAKVAGLRAAQLGPGVERALSWSDYRDCVALAARLARPRPRALVITHGLAGCGKTTVSQALLERTGAIRIRTDVERKRLAGLAAAARSRSAIDRDLYAKESTRKTYEHVLTLASCVVEGGSVALIDGAFLARWQRDLFRERASALGVPFIIVAVAGYEATLRRRIERRARLRADASEADVAVLEHQQLTQEPLEDDEQAFVVTLDGEFPVVSLRSTTGWRALLERIGAGAADPARSAGDAPELAQSARVVAFLSRPASYGGRNVHVERIETHLSWIFLTDRHAYKLKKPVLTDFVDLRTLAARHRNATEEVRLNRRLTSNVYLGAVPVLVGTAGRFSLIEGDEIADWLVQMRRLPRERMLDQMIARGSVGGADIAAIARRLCEFHRNCPAGGLSATQYRDQLAADIADDRRELLRPEYGLPAELVDDVCARQLAVLEHAETFAARVRAGRIVECHGDLRPEHICMEAEPQIIDCLDFSRALRTQDTADEVGFLALECERLGAPGLRDTLLDAYRAHCGDSPPDELVHFYQSYRAGVRAKIAVWHLREPGMLRLDKWRNQANAYLQLARRHIERCA